MIDLIHADDDVEPGLSTFIERGKMCLKSIKLSHLWIVAKTHQGSSSCNIFFKTYFKTNVN